MLVKRVLAISTRGIFTRRNNMQVWDEPMVEPQVHHDADLLTGLVNGDPMLDEDGNKASTPSRRFLLPIFDVSCTCTSSSSAAAETVAAMGATCGRGKG